MAHAHTRMTSIKTGCLILINSRKIKYVGVSYNKICMDFMMIGRRKKKVSLISSDALMTQFSFISSSILSPSLRENALSRPLTLRVIGGTDSEENVRTVSGGRISTFMFALVASSDVHCAGLCGNEPARGAVCGPDQDRAGDRRNVGMAGRGAVGGGAGAGTEARRRTPRRGLV